jgi:hypothetical protein
MLKMFRVCCGHLVQGFVVSAYRRMQESLVRPPNRASGDRFLYSTSVLEALTSS